MQHSLVCDPSTAMSPDDFNEAAELFVARGIGRRGGLGYRRFGTASDAIAFAVETFASARPEGVVMVIGDKRFDLGAIRSLHRLEQQRTEQAD